MQKLLTDQSARKVPRMAPLCVGSTIELTHWNNSRHLIDSRLIRWINDHQTIQFLVVIGIETYILFSNFNENMRRITTLVSLRKRSNKKPSFKDNVNDEWQIVERIDNFIKLRFVETNAHLLNFNTRS